MCYQTFIKFLFFLKEIRKLEASKVVQDSDIPVKIFKENGKHWVFLLSKYAAN